MHLLYRTLFYIIYLYINLTMVNILSAQETIFDNIIAISNNYTLTAKSGNKYKLKAIDISKNHANINIISSMILGKQLKFIITPNSIDRYSRIYADIYDEDNIWLNAELIKNGLAILSGNHTGNKNFSYLLKQENMARNKNIGGWANGDFKIYNAQPYDGGINKFAIVEGIVLQVKKINQRIYINFDNDWRTDFSIGIKKPLWEKFKNIGIDATDLAKKHITIRGWVRQYNGAYMEIHQIGQLQLNH